MMLKLCTSKYYWKTCLNKPEFLYARNSASITIPFPKRRSFSQHHKCCKVDLETISFGFPFGSISTFLISWFSGGIREFKEKVCLPCDDRKIRNAHQDYLLEALTFFETEAEDTAVMARWMYIEELAVNNEFDVDI